MYNLFFLLQNSNVNLLHFTFYYHVWTYKTVILHLLIEAVSRHSDCFVVPRNALWPCGFVALCEKEPHTKPPRHQDTKKARRMNVITVNNALWLRVSV
jgi:uncharacterized membrane protein YccF (DUF307 family)